MGDTEFMRDTEFIGIEHSGEGTARERVVLEREGLEWVDYNPRLGIWYSRDPRMTPEKAAEYARKNNLRYESTGPFAGSVTRPAPPQAMPSPATHDRALRANARE